MVFDKPMWRWLVAHEEQITVGLVRNHVLVCPTRGRERSAYVVVPSEFFLYLHQTEQADVLDRAREAEGVSFYLEQYGNHWIFGYFVGEEPTDLWYYTDEKKPNWV